MYIKGNTIYADAGKILTSGPVAAFQLEAAHKDVAERDCPVRGVKVDGQTASWSGITISLPSSLTYAALKEKLIKLRYSLDAQMAVLCNGDTEEFDRMQRWREWAAEVAKAIAAKAGIAV